MNDILEGDCLEVMKTFPDNHFSAIVTDPPYGISFMGKGWDCETPGYSCWEECLRVTKPGGFLIAFGGTRTFHKLVTAIEQAGFEVRDTISWIYGSGFPKSLNNFGIEGYGTALKPAQELCTLVMKPLDGTFKQNADKWGQAGINVDGCRIGTDKVEKGHFGRNAIAGLYDLGIKSSETKQYSKGRWPANVILDEEAGRMLDEQSGTLKSGTLAPHHKFKNNHPGWGMDSVTGKDWPSTSGGASRFFYCAKTSSRERNEGLEEFEQKEGPYASFGINTDEGLKNRGRNPESQSRKQHNHHPTVKPLSLMEYLIKLVMPPKNGLLLDPFAGSGSTILAAKRLSFPAIGIENSAEYCAIARARIEAANSA